MRGVALLLVVVGGCGGQPALSGAPHPNNGAIAGVAAGAAAAITLADPSRAGTKESAKDNEKNAVEVDATVPSDVFDRLDHPPDPKPVAPPPAKRKGPPPKLPSPEDAAKQAP